MNPILKVLIWIAVGMGIMWLIMTQTCNRTDPGTGVPPSEIRRWHDDSARAWATVAGLRADFAIVQGERDSLAEVLKVKPTSIKEYIIKTVAGAVRLLPGDTIRIVDTSGHFWSAEQRFTNPYYNAFAHLGRDSSWIDLRTFDTVTTVWRDSVLKDGKKWTLLDISFANPYNQVTGIKSYQFAPTIVPVSRPKRFGFGFQLGFGGAMDIRTRRAVLGPYVGVGGSYNFIRL